MTTSYGPPHAVFSGALGDKATNGWYPAHAVLSDGFVTLWIAGSTGWQQQFSVPAGEVVVKSAAQRITLHVRGRSYPILADPQAVTRALGLNAIGALGNVAGMPGVRAGTTAGRAVNQVGAAQAFDANGGAEFLAAMRYSGARVSRLGYGALVGMGCGGALLIAVLIIAFAAAFS